MPLKSTITPQADKLIDTPITSNKWYVISCYGGQEKSLCDDLSAKVKLLNLQDRIFEIKIVKNVVFSKKDKKQVEKNLFPGYVFINMEMDDDLWFMIRNIKYVKGFIGSSALSDRPFPLYKDEVAAFLKPIKSPTHDKSDNQVKIDLKIDDFVTILVGPFKGYEGQVKNIFYNTKKIVVNIDFFDRQTPLELDFHNLKNNFMVKKTV